MHLKIIAMPLAGVLLGAAYPFKAHAVNIDVGRQLFVDDALVAKTELKRVWHYPKKYEGNPVLKPEMPWEMNAGGNAATVPKGGGIWWDAKEQVFKLWYEGGWLHTVCYATSKDGLSWERPKLDVVEGTNIVLPTNNPAFRPDSWSVVKDPNPPRPGEQYKLLLHRPNVAPDEVPVGVCAVSDDGIHWKCVYPLPASGDRSSLYFNPFADEWVYSLRAAGTSGHFMRQRSIYTQPDFLKIPENWWGMNPLPGMSECWDYTVPRWMGPDPKLDANDSAVADPKRFPKAQLYNFDAVAYESILLGLFEIHLGPENDVCEKRGLPKITDVKFGFSRGKNNFKRYDSKAAIASERWGSEKWDTGYVQPVANGCVVMGDELWFYYGAFRGEPQRANANGKTYEWTVNNGMYANGAMGIAKLRRDGFASLEGTGELLTVPLEFAGEYLFVNVDARAGSLAAELVNAKGQVVEGFSAADCVVKEVDSTRLRLTWKTRDRLNVPKLKGHRLRFRLENAALYAFWISLTPKGESNGYLAGGGPGYDGLRDIPKNVRGVIAPKIHAPDTQHRLADRRHEGIPSIAVSAKGTMWATWYGGKTPGEDENNYVILSRSVDGGKTWAEFLVCDPDLEGPRRTFDPEIWMAPDGKLRWTWTDRVGPLFSDFDQLWMATLDADSGEMLEAPRMIANGVMMNKPTVLRDGMWIFPVAQWGRHFSALCYASTDGGKTFQCRGGVPVRNHTFDEHTILEKRDGTLKCYIRSDGLSESESTDGGRTWSAPRRSRVGNADSRTFVQKLRDGRWILVKHHAYSIVPGREKLTALISEDDGETWWGGLLLDGRKGCSYPDGQQLADGSVVVVNDFDRYGRREISFVRFSPDDIVPATPRPERRVISSAVTNGDAK